MKQIILKFLKKIKTYIIKVIRIKKSPHSIALGFAIGTFISVLPTPGFNIALGALVILLFPKINKFSLFGSMLLWNPLTSVPIYTLSYKIGHVLFVDLPIVGYDVSFLYKIFTFTRRFLVGNFILALFSSLIGYLLVWSTAKVYQTIKNNRVKKRK